MMWYLQQHRKQSAVGNGARLPDSLDSCGCHERPSLLAGHKTSNLSTERPPLAWVPSHRLKVRSSFGPRSQSSGRAACSSIQLHLTTTSTSNTAFYPLNTPCQPARGSRTRSSLPSLLTSLRRKKSECAFFDVMSSYLPVFSVAIVRFQHHRCRLSLLCRVHVFNSRDRASLQRKSSKDVPGLAQQRKPPPCRAIA